MVNKTVWFDRINVTLLSLFCLSIIFPFLFVLSQSLMSNEDIMRYGATLIPKQIVLYAYEYLLVDNTFVYRAFANSIFVTVVGTALCLMLTGGMAYAFSKKYLPYRNTLTLLVLFTMFFSGGLIPNYLLVVTLGLKNSLWALIAPGLVNVWFMFLLRNFFMEIPREVEESAYIDGANDVRVLVRIVLPMSLPAIVTIGLFYAVGFWNSWFSASIYIDDKEKWPLQLLLKSMLVSFNPAEGGGVDQSQQWLMLLSQDSVRAATIIITAVPVLFVYPFIQKYFVKGIVIGSIKG